MARFTTTCPSTQAQRYYDQQEASSQGACEAAALAAGISADNAEACDDGDQCCPTCPWRATSGKWKAPNATQAHTGVWRVWVCPEVAHDGTVGGHFVYSTSKVSADYERVSAAELAKLANKAPK